MAETFLSTLLLMFISSRYFIRNAYSRAPAKEGGGAIAPHFFAQKKKKKNDAIKNENE